MLVLHVTASRFCLYFLNIYHLTPYVHIFACAYKGAHTQAHMCAQHTRGMATTRHRSQVGRGGSKAFFRDKGLAHTQKKKTSDNTILTNLRQYHTHES